MHILMRLLNTYDVLLCQMERSVEDAGALDGLLGTTQQNQTLFDRLQQTLSQIADGLQQEQDEQHFPKGARRRAHCSQQLYRAQLHTDTGEDEIIHVLSGWQSGNQTVNHVSKLAARKYIDLDLLNQYELN